MVASLETLRSAPLARWVSAVALAALLIAVSAFLAHQHAAIQKVQGSEQSCDLCLNLTTPALTPADVTPIRIVLNVGRLLPADNDAPTDANPLHRYRSRAPPFA